jgi:hypothetical protein
LLGDGALPDTECAIVLVRNGAAQFHLGLRHDSGPPEPVLHLAWHRRFGREALEKLTRSDGTRFAAAVIVPALDPLVDEALQVLARRVGRRYASSPSAFAYGFGEASGQFDPKTGEVSDPDAAFTCATFVLALLRSVGVRLLDSARWRALTVEDIEWQQRVGRVLLDWIEKHIHGDLPRARERVAHDLGSRRYRPSDVAGAALFARGRWPVGSEDVDPRAQQIEAALPWGPPPA